MLHIGDNVQQRLDEGGNHLIGMRERKFMWRGENKYVNYGEKQ